jgi:hypothetical protein
MNVTTTRATQARGISRSSAGRWYGARRDAESCVEFRAQTRPGPALYSRRTREGRTTMATDYDQPRTDDSDLGEDSLEELKARRDQQAGAVDVDEAELAESLELPGADLSGEELTVRVVPKQVDEFTCMSCFLVRHRSQLANEKKMICKECAQ